MPTGLHDLYWWVVLVGGRELERPEESWNGRKYNRGHGVMMGGGGTKGGQVNVRGADVTLAKELVKWGEQVEM